MSEIDVMKNVETALESLEEGARKRVLDWAYAKYIGHRAIIPESSGSHAVSNAKQKKPAKRTSSTRRIKKKSMPRIVKDLNLVPKGKQSGKEFAEEKSPVSVKSKCVVAAYYLREIININEISVDHIYSFFKIAGWPIPKDLVNTLQQAGSAGWLDTADQTNILITTMGENLVEHGLPPKAPKKK